MDSNNYSKLAMISIIVMCICFNVGDSETIRWNPITEGYTNHYILMNPQSNNEVNDHNLSIIPYDIYSDIFYGLTSFRIVPALNGENDYISFQSVHSPNLYIRHCNFKLLVSSYLDNALSDCPKNTDDASWKQVPAMNGNAEHVSYQSSNFPNHYWMHINGKMFIHYKPNDESEIFDRDASWDIATPIQAIVQVVWENEREIQELETLEDAQLYVRDVKSDEAEDEPSITVKLLEGTIYLTNGEPIDFNASDSGYSADNKIIYRPYEGNLNNVIISGGYLLPSQCFQQFSTFNTINIYECNMANYMNNIKKPDFRSIRIGSYRGTPARYPKLSLANPYTDGWLFIWTLKQVDTPLTEDREYIMGVKNSSLSSTIINANFQGKIHLFPQASWTDMELRMESIPNYNDDDMQPDLSYFRFFCSRDDYKCGNITENKAAKIRAGCRFYFYDAPKEIIPLEQVNEWSYDSEQKKIYIASTDRNIHVVIPNTDYIMRFMGDFYLHPNNLNHGVVDSVVQHIEFENIVFMDNDYSSNGFQGDFNLEAYSGVPEDGSIRISAANEITFRNCEFLELAGAGIVISNKSTNITIANNKFEHIGQSAIMIIGKNGRKSTRVKVENNTISYIGEILASSAGIYGSCVDNSEFVFNNIRYVSRWGITIRTNRGWATSLNNIVKFNVIDAVGLSTSDFGAISLYGGEGIITNTAIMYNCVTNTIGRKSVDWACNRCSESTDNYGNMNVGYGFGIYLDNFATGYNVSNNVVYNVNGAGIYVHGGQSNWIENNIFYNTTAQFRVKYLKYVPIAGNTMLRNVFYWFDGIFGEYDDSNPNARSNLGSDWFSQIDYNLYYNPNININNYDELYTPAGPTWNSWINGYDNKFDQNSIIDTNPMFDDIRNGNFGIDEQSTLITQLNFKPLPTYLSNNCGISDWVEYISCPNTSVTIAVQGQFNDIGGCGLEACEDRYDKNTSKECENHCRQNENCESYTWTSRGGDQFHPSVRVCTIYSVSIPNHKWGRNQIMCQPIIQ